MDYNKPADVVRTMVDTAETKLALEPRDLLIRGALSGALLGTATKGYSRALPQDQQPQPDLGIVSIVARESPSLPGKTLLMCEFVLKADQEALDRYEKSRTP